MKKITKRLQDEVKTLTWLLEEAQNNLDTWQDQQVETEAEIANLKIQLAQAEIKLTKPMEQYHKAWSRNRMEYQNPRSRLVDTLRSRLEWPTRRMEDILAYPETMPPEIKRLRTELDRAQVNLAAALTNERIEAEKKAERERNRAARPAKAYTERQQISAQTTAGQLSKLLHQWVNRAYVRVVDRQAEVFIRLPLFKKFAAAIKEMDEQEQIKLAVVSDADLVRAEAQADLRQSTRYTVERYNQVLVMIYNGGRSQIVTPRHPQDTSHFTLELVR